MAGLFRCLSCLQLQGRAPCANCYSFLAAVLFAWRSVSPLFPVEYAPNWPATYRLAIRSKMALHFNDGLPPNIDELEDVEPTFTIDFSPLGEDIFGSSPTTSPKRTKIRESGDPSQHLASTPHKIELHIAGVWRIGESCWCDLADCSASFSLTVL